ncbi:hypothetical protein [Geminocystis sp. NIES-3709]|uniref:hypothetical protein n=1 Tax=Geminocystis sp. NIES-3709 TaxID=1617448 RepID=UPI0005FC4AB6|nr:hypothetical protein [Geminocystis sp. NIES-3709]BAQ66347.1 hypothetical protein GM3709_3112 [Geminocystis sp. NIES-3709]
MLFQFFKIKNYYLLILTIFCLLFLNFSKVQGQHNQNNTQSDNHHTHKSIDVSNNSQIPSVKIKVFPDTIKGWNLEIETTNFIFKPETLNRESNSNEGHAHLYINGKKITRIYGKWYHIPDLPKGKNEIKVTLNTNLHEDLIYNGNVISDQIIVEH